MLETHNVGTVVVTLGTTALGAIDPLDDIIPVARAAGARVHVDGAYGGFFALVADAGSLLVVVGRFLALLELYREHVVLFDQVAPLGDLTIRWVGSEAGDVDVTDEFDVERDVDQRQQGVSRTQDVPERNDR